MVLLLLVGTAIGGSVSFLQRPAYVSTAKAYVFVSTATNVGDLASSSAYTQQVAASFADIAGTSYVLRPVISRLNLRVSPAELAQAVSVTAVANESVLEIQATDSSARRSARIANAVADRLTTTVGSLTPQTNRATVIKVTVVDPAVPPSTPVRPLPLLYVGIGAAAGLVLGVLLALLREVLDTRVRTVRDVEAVTAVPVLGSTPLDGNLRRHPIALGEGVQGPLAETYRSLRTSLQFLSVDEGLRSVVITSSIASEGKSITALNLAVALAEAGERVVLVDADLRRPSISRLIGIDGTIGLTDVLIGTVDLDQALQAGDRQHLTVLPSGTVPPNPNELLQTRALDGLLDELEARFDRVVIDAPPILPVSDAAILAHRSSGALLVVAAGHVKRAQVDASMAAFAQTGAPVLGVVLTMVPPRESAAVTSGGYYRHAGDPVRPADRRIARSERSAGPPDRTEDEGTDPTDRPNREENP
jgi:capsular exopolysaccharide synthesis family protein